MDNLDWNDNDWIKVNNGKGYDLNGPLTWINGHGYDLNEIWHTWNKDLRKDQDVQWPMT